MASRVRGKASEAERHASQEALSGCCPTRPDSHPQSGGHPRCVKPAVALTPEGMMPAKGGNPALTDEQVKATVDWMIAQVK